jgi:hypothetical protein
MMTRTQQEELLKTVELIECEEMMTRYQESLKNECTFNIPALKELANHLSNQPHLTPCQVTLLECTLINIKFAKDVLARKAK